MYQRPNHIKFFISFFLFVSLYLATAICPAQEQSVVLSRVSLENTNFVITGITPDTRGYMWFASASGLYRYDGYHLVQYSHDPLSPNSLASNTLECVYGAKNGLIWVGTKDAGLDRLDPETGIFTHFRPNLHNHASLCSDVIWVLTEDREGMLWIGTDKGLNRLDPKTGEFTCYLYDAKDSTSLSNNFVKAIYEDHDGILWVGTGSPWEINLPWKEFGGLNRFDRNTGNFRRYLHDPKDPHSLFNNRVRAIFEDSQGRFGSVQRAMDCIR